MARHARFVSGPLPTIQLGANALRPVLPASAGWVAELELAYAIQDTPRGPSTVPVTRRHVGPLRVQRHLYPDDSGACHQLVIHPPGGIVGGDSLDINVSAGPGTDVLLTAPGATKWYRSAGMTATQTLHLRAGPGARLAWLPQPAIVFDGARVVTRTTLDVAADATVIFWDVMALGRPRARPEPSPFVSGDVDAALAIGRDGQLLVDERSVFAAGDRWTRSPFGLHGQTAVGTLYALGPAVDAAVPLIRDLLASEGERVGVTFRDGVLIVRALGACSDRIFLAFTHVWAALGKRIDGSERTRPRIWQT